MLTKETIYLPLSCLQGGLSQVQILDKSGPGLFKRSAFLRADRLLGERGGRKGSDGVDFGARLTLECLATLDGGGANRKRCE